MSWLGEDNWCDSSCAMSWFLEDEKAGVVVWCQLRIRIRLACASSCAYIHTHTLSCASSCAYSCEQLCIYFPVCTFPSFSCTLPSSTCLSPFARAPLHVRPCTRSLSPLSPIPIPYPGAHKAHGQADWRGMACQPLVNRLSTVV